MRIPRIAVDNHHFTLVLILLLCLFGAYAFLSMPRSEDPQITVPGASVVVVYPGASSGEMEHLVIDILEEAVNELEDIDQIGSTSGDGIADLGVEFVLGSDPDEKFREFVEKIESVRSELPAEILSLETFKWEVGTVNILQLALVSETAAYPELKREADMLRDLLEQVGGVRRVKIHACPDQEVSVALDPERMAGMGLSLNQVIAAIRDANAEIPGGSIDSGGRRFTVRTSGLFRSLDEIRSTVVHSAAGTLVALKDIAAVKMSDADNEYRARYNGRRAIFITLSQKQATNIFRINRRISPLLEEFRSTLPPAMKLYTAFDQSESVARRFRVFFGNLLQGILLVGLIVFLGVGRRQSLIVVLVIPLSLLIGVGFVHLSGFGLQQMTIAGLVIVLGILVDNAIVVTENISRYLYRGETPLRAALLGASQVGWAITSATATTLLAFLPLITMQNLAGRFIRSMPVTVLFTLTASLLLALTFSPYLASRILAGGKMQRRSWMHRHLEGFIHGGYTRFLDWCLHHTAWVLGSALVLLAAAVLVFVFFVGTSFFPKAEKPQFMINVVAPRGSSVARTDEAVRFAERALAGEEAIEHYAANIGKGNPRIYYNLASLGERSYYGQIFVQLVRYDPRETPFLLEELRRRFAGYPGARIEVKELEQGPPMEAPVAIRVMSSSLKQLEELSREVERRILEVPGTINVSNPLGTTRTDIRVRVNRDKAGLLGVSLADIDRAVRAGLSGLAVSTYRDPEGREYDIVCRLGTGGTERKPGLPDLERIRITSVTGSQIPLRQLAVLELASGPAEIRHFNLERSVTVTADVSSRASVREVTRQVVAGLEGISWPRGTRYHVAGETENQQESFGGLGMAVLIALVGIFGVLVLQFRSFSQPFIIFSSLPLAFIGSVAALYISGLSFSFTAFVGLTSLVGIVVNDAIILVDFANQLVREGKETVSALKEAGQVRFISIILTSATTIAGLLPLTLRGGTLWAPMGLAIIGGLFSSTALTLIVVPVLFKLFSRVAPGRIE
jgi:multidrug efflux pump subunit AcrB